MSLLAGAWITCPYCGEAIELVIDPSVQEQEYIEDCEVCCRPIVLTIAINPEGQIDIQPRHENDAV